MLNRYIIIIIIIKTLVDLHHAIFIRDKVSPEKEKVKKKSHTIYSSENFHVYNDIKKKKDRNNTKRLDKSYKMMKKKINIYL